MESTTWPTVDFQVTPNEQVLISRALMDRSLKVCPLVSYCLWLNLCWADVLCWTLIRPDISGILPRGPIQTASGFKLPKSTSFLWEEDKVNYANNGLKTTFLQHELVVKSTCGVESRVSNRAPMTLWQGCAALLLTVDTPGHLWSAGG